MPTKKLGRLEASSYRTLTLDIQGQRCALCCETVHADEAVLDHDHKTGHCRAVLHRGCNAMLGHIENNRPRNSLTGHRLFNMLARVESYLTRDYSDKPIYHLHRTDDEKRELRNKRARKRTALKKAST